MAGIDLSALTVAQLETMQTNLLAAHARTLSSKSYSIGSRSLQRESSESILDQLGCISTELTTRTDTAAGCGVVEFGEPI